MWLRICQFGALTGLTALEAIRQPICLLLASTCVASIGLIPMLVMHVFGEDGRLARDSALALHFVFGLFIAGYTACSSLTREMRNGTASVVLSKPVSRGTFFLAKYAGMTVVILAFSWCASLATLLAERIAERYTDQGGVIGYFVDYRAGLLLVAAPFAAYLAAAWLNYRKRRPFESTAFLLFVATVTLAFLACGFFNRLGHFQKFDLLVQWRILPASLLVTAALLILSGIALSLSTRMGTVPTLGTSGALLFLGLTSDHFFGHHEEGFTAAGTIYGLVPNWQHFWMPDALAAGGSIPLAYLGYAAAYGALYLAGVLLLGLVSFRQAEIQ
jgi:hypothetical protein